MNTEIKTTIATALDMYLASVKRAKNQSNWSPLYEEANAKQQEYINDAKKWLNQQTILNEQEKKK